MASFLTPFGHVTDWFQVSFRSTPLALLGQRGELGLAAVDLPVDRRAVDIQPPGNLRPKKLS